MKHVPVILMVAGIIFVLWGIGMGYGFAVGLVIAGSILIGSGVIAHAITEGFAKKHEADVENNKWERIVPE